MAIYHLHVNTVSRASGGAAADSADYIEREGKYQAGKAEVMYAEHGNMPDWANKPKDYWQAADIYERANGRLCVRVEFALPKELTPSQQTALAREFCQAIAQTSQGQKLPYSMAIHRGRDGNNPHCHVMINERINDGISRQPSDWFRRANPKDPEKGGAQKTEELRPKLWLIEAREKWSEMANQALERHGHNAAIDHRTLAAQGIDRIPQYHLGPAAAAMERKHAKGEKAVTERGAAYNANRHQASIIADLEAELKAELMALKQEDTQQTISEGRADVRAKFERMKADRAAQKEAQAAREAAKASAKEKEHAKEKIRVDYGHSM